ncbi:DUF4097 domain-containing protein [Amycolatopsis acidicola]|uniref:DUF4097 domain-containing protein n=1 Tax=Amycolatopsis acidicola TaxID=2596893 RepID=A0A5N0UTF0_9PSEU|nr:DUF4097 family beta strand repeat-containing protein [Amycolatopsis acidicola]KAA9153067.1 DUF4097 domain-containing protein [Amycolatopsis acidicola]
MGRPVLAIGGVAMIGAGVAIALGWWWPSSAHEDRQVTVQVSSVQLDIVSAEAHVRAADVSTTTVRQEFRYHGGKPSDAFRVEGGKLVLTGCGHNCSVDYEVVVPRGTTLSGTSTSGDINAEGLASTDVSSTSGEIHITDAAGPVRAHASSGDITVAERTAADVQAETSSGNVHVTVPSASFRVVCDTTSGDQRIDIPTDPAGAHLLDLRATSGDVSVSPA